MSLACWTDAHVMIGIANYAGFIVNISHVAPLFILYIYSKPAIQGLMVAEKL